MTTNHPYWHLVNPAVLQLSSNHVRCAFVNQLDNHGFRERSCNKKHEYNDREEEAGKGSRGESQANKVGVPSNEQDAGHARGGDNTSILSFPLCTILPE